MSNLLQYTPHDICNTALRLPGKLTYIYLYIYNFINWRSLSLSYFLVYKYKSILMKNRVCTTHIWILSLFLQIDTHGIWFCHSIIATIILIITCIIQQIIANDYHDCVTPLFDKFSKGFWSLTFKITIK